MAVLTRRYVWAWLLGCLLIAVAILVVWRALPSPANRYAKAMQVQGYRQSAKWPRSEWAVTTYWVGPTKQDPKLIVRGDHLHWLNGEGSISLLGDGYFLVAAAKADVYGTTCYVDVSKADVTFWLSKGNGFPAGVWGLSDAELEGVNSGSLDVLAIDIECG